MIYGDPQIHIDTDETDRVGLRTLALSQIWQPSRWPMTLAELADEEPDIPEVEGGVLFVGKQRSRLRGALRTHWIFEGIEGDGKSVTFKDRSHSIDYNFEPGFSQVSIVKHPNWQKLKDTWGGQVIDGQVIWPEFVPQGGSSSGAVKNDSEGQPNPMFGEVDFFRVEGTYSFRYLAFDFGISQQGVGRIATNLPGRPPTYPDRNWLKAPSPFQRRGPVIEIVEVYWLSGAGGWPRPIYTNDPTSGGGSGPTNSLSPSSGILPGFNG